MQPFLYLRAGEVHRLLTKQCNMQQTTIQFDQVLQEQHSVDVMAPIRKAVQVVNKAVAWCRSHREQLECYVGGPLSMAFCAALYYLASVLEGGAL